MIQEEFLKGESIHVDGEAKEEVRSKGYNDLFCYASGGTSL